MEERNRVVTYLLLRLPQTHKFWLGISLRRYGCPAHQEEEYVCMYVLHEAYISFGYKRRVHSLNKFLSSMQRLGTQFSESAAAAP